MNTDGRILSRRFTGVCFRHQKKVARTIKRSRRLGVFTYKKGFTINTHYELPPQIEITVQPPDFAKYIPRPAYGDPDQEDVRYVEELDEDKDDIDEPEDDIFQPLDQGLLWATYNTLRKARIQQDMQRVGAEESEDKMGSDITN